MTDAAGAPVSEPAPPAGEPWDVPFEQAPLVWLDLEMTGIDPERDRICEIAAIRVRGGVEEAALVQLVDPGMPVGDSAAIHHLDDAQLAGCPPLGSLRGPLADLLAGAVIVGHCVHHDLRFLAGAAARGELGPAPGWALDTRLLARRAWHHGRYGLAALAAAHDLPAPQHRAESDARTAGALLERLRAALRATTPRHLWQAQPREGVRRFRDDTREVMREAAQAGWPVRFAYRVPGREPFEDELEVQRFAPPHVEGHVRARDLRMTLRGDRVLWATRAE